MSQIVSVIIALAIAIILHELAHGVVAAWLGDNTARLMGRLTLNPFRHIDPTGSVIVPAILVVGQILTMGRVAFMYGWAKPVPVNPANLRLGNYQNGRRLMAIVALAGPVMNFLLAVLGGLAVHVADAMQSMSFLVFLVYFIQVNLLLGLFNLIPLLPMDGGRVIVGILPLKLAEMMGQLEKIGIFAVLLVLFVLPLVMQHMGFDFDPLSTAVGFVLPKAESVVLMLTGNSVGSN